MKQDAKSEVRMAILEGGMRPPFVLRPSFIVIVVALFCGLTKGQSEPTTAPSRLSYDSFRMISDRNIFNPNRYARSSGSARPRTTSQPALRVEYFTLVGLMAYEKGTFAFFDGTSGNYKKTLEADGAISDFKISGMTSDQVKLISGTNEFVMRVGMQVRREDEGDWFLTEANQPTRNRVVVSRGRSRTANATGDGIMGLPEGMIEGALESEPEIIIVEPETMTEGAEQNGNGEAANAATETPNNANGITDPVLLRLMQRRQELNQ